MLCFIVLYIFCFDTCLLVIGPTFVFYSGFTLDFKLTAQNLLVLRI